MADHERREDPSQAAEQAQSARSVTIPFSVVGCILFIVVLVIVTIAILTMLGPVIGNVYTDFRSI